MAGMPDRVREMDKFKKMALGTAVKRLIQTTAQAHHVEAEMVLDKLGLESLEPFLGKKDIPGQADHLEKEI